MMDIKLIQYGVGIFAETSCENDNLIYFTHLFEEIVNPGSLEHMKVMPVVFNLNGDNKIGLLYSLEATVYQSLVKIQDQTFSPNVLWCNGR